MYNITTLSNQFLIQLKIKTIQIKKSSRLRTKDTHVPLFEFPNLTPSKILGCLQLEFHRPNSFVARYNPVHYANSHKRRSRSRACSQARGQWISNENAAAPKAACSQQMYIYVFRPNWPLTPRHPAPWPGTRAAPYLFMHQWSVKQRDKISADARCGERESFWALVSRRSLKGWFMSAFWSTDRNLFDYFENFYLNSSKLFLWFEFCGKVKGIYWEN